MTKKLTKKIQKKLGLRVDGIWGKNTANALIEFQLKNGLRPNGSWSRKTETLMFPTAKSKTIELIIKQCEVLGVTKVEQIQYIIATAKHETGGTLKAIKEKGGDKYLSRLYDPILGKSKRLRDRAVKMGNTKEGDGVKYCGRGLVQLTWKNNYEKYGEIMDIDLVNNPNLALDINVAVFILVHGMKHGVFTGKRLDDYISDKGSDFVSARNIINGQDKAEKIALITCSIPALF